MVVIDVVGLKNRIGKLKISYEEFSSRLGIDLAEISKGFTASHLIVDDKLADRIFNLLNDLYITEYLWFANLDKNKEAGKSPSMGKKEKEKEKKCVEKENIESLNGVNNLKEFIDGIKVLEEENKGLKMNNEFLAKDNYRLTEDSGRLTKENDRLIKENNRLTKENEDLKHVVRQLDSLANCLGNSFNSLKRDYTKLKVSCEGYRKKCLRYEEILEIASSLVNRC